MTKKGKDFTFNVLDLFSGAGGLSLGFNKAGFNIIMAVESNYVFGKSYQLNHKKTPIIIKNIRDIEERELKERIGKKNVDVIIGGPPCQGFSLAGKRDKTDPRNSLFMDFLRFVVFFKPSWILVENVPGILSMRNAQGKKVIDLILSEFKKIGYNVKYKKLIALDFGVPQKRERVFIIATNTKKSISFPRATHFKRPSYRLDGKKTYKWKTIKSVILSESKIPESFFHSQRMIEGFKRRKEKNKKDGKGFGYQILDINKPSYTIVSRYWKDGSNALIKYSENRIRMLTPLECARIQGFSDNYIFQGNLKDQYIQIGNAVPPPLAYAIAKEIKRKIEQRRN